MKISEKNLKILIKESLDQMHSRGAIRHPGKMVRKDGISFEQWIEELISGAMHMGLPIEHEDDLPSDVRCTSAIDIWKPQTSLVE